MAKKFGRKWRGGISTGVLPCGQRRAGPAKAYKIGQRLDEGTQAGPRTGSNVPARGDLTGVGRTPNLAMPLKRNARGRADVATLCA